MARFTNGWVKAWRKAAESDLVDNMVVWSLWHWLLYAASWMPTKKIVNGVQRELPAGSVLFSPKEVSALWGCSESVVRKWLNYLHDTGRIVRKPCARGTVVTICNWDIYQSGETEPCADREDGVREPCGSREGAVHLTEESKKGRKKETNTRRCRSEYDQAFEEVYGTYPRKEGKSGGKKIFDKLSGEDRALVPVAIQNYRTKKAGTESQFLLHFKTFMGQWRDWLDAETGTAVPPVAKSARDEADDLLKAYEAEKAAYEAQADEAAS